MWDVCPGLGKGFAPGSEWTKIQEVVNWGRPSPAAAWGWICCKFSLFSLILFLFIEYLVGYLWV